MGFKYNSVVRFKSENDVGLDRVALGSLIQVTYDFAEVTFQYKNDAGVTSSTTIIQALAAGNINGFDLVHDKSPQLGGDLYFNGKTMNEQAVRQIVWALPTSGTTHTFDYAEGDMQGITAPAGGTLTLAFANFPAGVTSGFIVDIRNGGNCTIIHPAGMRFARGEAPDYTVSGYDRFIVVSDRDNNIVMTTVAIDHKV